MSISLELCRPGGVEAAGASGRAGHDGLQAPHVVALLPCIMSLFTPIESC